MPPIQPGTSGTSKILLGPGPHHSLAQWLSACEDQASFPMNGLRFLPEGYQGTGLPLACCLGRRDPNIGWSKTYLIMSHDG